MKNKTNKITSATEVKSGKAADKYKKCCHFDKEYNKKSTLTTVEDGIRRERVCSICGEVIEWWEIDTMTDKKKNKYGIPDKIEIFSVNDL